MFEVCGRGEKMKYKILGVQKKSKLIFVKERCWGKIAFGKKNVWIVGFPLVGRHVVKHGINLGI